MGTTRLEIVWLPVGEDVLFNIKGTSNNYQSVTPAK
jgi:hypothetical protein